ncbi:hypothetical protein VIBNISOn1_890028 [Vibrio nigripulchritudo SOn1]|uniref:Uncharacterized protein n=1 Tax=Vibrio nigripulchritudo SOn1 TaxID=1238450 RepID=A0AAV2VY97_9VIBR|nr:hypothetical protein VIBNISOn1_890028 [Vibrio nigripulchritudo SOn1]
MCTEESYKYLYQQGYVSSAAGHVSLAPYTLEKLSHRTLVLTRKRGKNVLANVLLISYQRTSI